jgi:hypothetical protein
MAAVIFTEMKSDFEFSGDWAATIPEKRRATAILYMNCPILAALEIVTHLRELNRTIEFP